MMRAFGIAALVLALASHRSARAETPEQPQVEHRGLSLLMNAGEYSGFGGGLAVGTRDVGVRGSVGWSPLLIVQEGASSGLKFYSGLLVGPDLYARVFKPRPTADIGGVAGYRYSSLLGHGLAVGGYAQVALSRAVDVNVSVGFLFFPDGEDRLKRNENLPSSTQFSFPSPNAIFAVGVGLAFFP